MKKLAIFGVLLLCLALSGCLLPQEKPTQTTGAGISVAYNGKTATISNGATAYGNITLLNPTTFNGTDYFLSDCDILTCTLNLKITPARAHNFTAGDGLMGKIKKSVLGKTSIKSAEYRTVQLQNFSEPTYTTVEVPYNVTDNDTGENSTIYYNDTIQNGTRIYQKNVTVWKTLPSTFSVQANKDYYLRLNYARASPSDVSDLVPSIFGQDIDNFAWWNASYVKIQGNSTTNGTCSAAYCQFSMYVAVNSTLTNGTEIRVTDCNATAESELGFWREDGWNYTNASGTLWVNITNNTGCLNVYQPLNKTGVADKSSVDNTFLFGDDFDGATANASKWTINDGSYVIANSSLYQTKRANTFISKMTFTTGVLTELVRLNTRPINSVTAFAGFWNASGVAYGYSPDSSATNDYLYKNAYLGTGAKDVYTAGQQRQVITSNGGIMSITSTTVSSGALYYSNTTAATYNTTANPMAIKMGCRYDSSSCSTDATGTQTNFVVVSAQNTSTPTFTFGAQQNYPYGNLTVNYTSCGTSTATGNNSTFTPPANLTINATASAGYYFVNWTSNCNGTFGNVSNINTYITVNDAVACYAQANFASILSSPLVNNFTDAATTHSFTVNGSVVDVYGGTNITATNISATAGICSQVSNSTSGNNFYVKNNCTATSPATPTIIIGFTASGGAYTSNSSTHAYPDHAANLTMPVVSSPLYPASIASYTPGTFGDIDNDVENTSNRTQQWYRNGTLLAGQTNATLNLSTLNIAAGENISICENTSAQNWTNSKAGNCSANITISPPATCYQETANNITTCGAYPYGSYAGGGNWSDGNYSTYSVLNSTPVYVNYSVSPYAINATMQIKWGSANASNTSNVSVWVCANNTTTAQFKMQYVNQSFGNGSDGSLIFTTTTKTYGNLVAGADYNNSSNTLYLNLDRVYNFVNITLGAGTTLSTNTTNGSVLFILYNDTAVLQETININGTVSVNYTPAKTIGGISFAALSVHSGGMGGNTTAAHGGVEGAGYGGGGAGTSVASCNAGYNFNGSNGTNGCSTGGTSAAPVSSSGAGCNNPFSYDANAPNATGCSAGGSGALSLYGSYGGSCVPYGTYSATSGGSASVYGGNAVNYTSSVTGSASFSCLNPGGGGGAGGQAGKIYPHIYIAGKTLNFSGSIPISGTNGQRGGNGSIGYSSLQGGGGGGGGAADAGNITFNYQTLAQNNGTISWLENSTGGAAGIGGTQNATAGTSGTSGNSSFAPVGSLMFCYYNSTWNQMFTISPTLNMSYLYEEGIYWTFSGQPYGNLTVNYTAGGTATGNNSTFIPPANMVVTTNASAQYYLVSCTASIGNCSIISTGTTSCTVQILNSTRCNVQANFAYLNVTITLPTGISNVSLRCFQPYMNDTQPDGQDIHTPILNVTNIGTLNSTTITLSLNQSLPTGLSVYACAANYRNPSCPSVNATAQTVLRSGILVNQSKGIWWFGNCANVTNNQAVYFNYTIGGT